ncbi:MAG: glyoxalase/bleomycin resistance/dioxygenase family protein [Brevundimonas sp.]|jgi:hypothetical protein|nr:glyoxalase/bleomycin resistance/dioxygenase family protein [Brevundimonas sp.]
MKRFHLHVAVEKLDESVKFYSALFAAEPTILRSDYAKWALDDPRVNFAISLNADNATGLNHLGVQAETAEELDELHQRLGAANIASQPETCARCCYAESDKHWAVDPTGIVWETFHTMGQIAVYGDDRGQAVTATLGERA